jgi:hypothetical protein
MLNLVKILLIMITTISLVGASSFGFDDPLIPELEPPIEYNVNISNFWDGLDTPSDIYVSSLGDTSVPAPNEGDVLTYNSTSSTWYATAGVGGGGLFENVNGWITNSTATGINITGRMNLYQGAGAGATAPTNTNSLVIERDNHAGITILTPTDKIGGIFFGDDVGSAGGINYNHATDLLRFSANSNTRMTLDDLGNLEIDGNLTTKGNNICNDSACFTLQELNTTGGTDTNCSVAGSCPDVAYMDYANTGNFNITGNITVTQYIKFVFGETIDNLVNGWLRLTGNVNVTGNLTVGGNNICNDSACFTLQELNTTGGAGGGGANETLIVNLTNNAGATTVVGYVYKIDSSDDNSFSYADENEEAQVVIATEAIADGGGTNVVISGYYDVYVNITESDVPVINRGDFLSFSDISGQARASLIRSEGVFAMTLENSSSDGLIKSIILPRSPIRKWSIVDEPTWIKTVPVPVSFGSSSVGTDPTGAGTWTRYASNPIFTDADVSWNNPGYYPGYPNIIYYKGYYYMFYALNNKVPGSTVMAEGVGVARADSLEGPWTEWNNGKAILVNGSTGSYDDNAVNVPQVIVDYDATETGTDQKWKMMYWSIQNSGSKQSASYAYSTSDPPATSTGTWTWTKYANNPVIDGRNMGSADYRTSGALLKLGKKFVYLLRTGSGVDALYTDNMTEPNWTTARVNWMTDASCDAVSYPQLYFDSGVFYIPYACYTNLGGGDTPYDINMAYGYDLSFDEIVELEKTNPVMSADSSSHENQHFIYPGTMMRDGTNYYMYYTAQNKSTIRSICYATLDLGNNPY